MQPGWLYVAATLLPLASFLVLLLAGGLKKATRPYRETDTPAGKLFHALGGDTPTKAGAYFATAAIGLACVLSIIGFIWLHLDPPRHSHAGPSHAHDHEEHEHATAHGDGWSGRISWAALTIAGQKPGEERPGTVLTLGYRIDHLAATMFLMVTFISTLIFIFSLGYMSEELAPTVEDHQVHTPDGHLNRRGRFGRFFLFLSLFCFSMLNLILADNLFQVFVSWELVGICSYLLIGFYYERSSASNAANKAFITNRIGDAGFILGLMILWTSVGTLNFEDLFQQVRAPLTDSHGEGITLAAQIVRGNPGVNRKGYDYLQIDSQGSEVLLYPLHPPDHYHPAGEIGDLAITDPRYQAERVERPKYRSMPYWLLVVAGLGIFLGCVGKSAQFPLHVWLPDAMEGPTPVSALIHAATMVAAGVYLVGRCYPLFTDEVRLVIAYTGGITLFVAATIAIVMTDIKKVLAYSTVSQLGYMMLALGVGGWTAGLFHLVTHAFFKALLFLGSGAVIYGCHHEQDMLKMGGLLKKMPITAYTMLVGVLAIAGIPLFTGWYSKDAILAQAFGFVIVNQQHLLLFLLPLITAGITTFYMFRMWFLTFTGPPRDHHLYDHAQEAPRVMTVPLIILAVCSVVAAWGWPLWDAEASYLEHLLHHAQHPAVIAEYGSHPHHGEPLLGSRPLPQTERYQAGEFHLLAGGLALGLVVVAILFASLVYYYRRLDAAEAQAQFPGVYSFLSRKWYFDELYSAVLVRPALVVAQWCRGFDLKGIDGLIDGLGRWTVRLTAWTGKFDLGIIDGLVNVLGQAVYGVGSALRNVQTGYLRSYVLFLVLAVLGIFAVLSYFVTRAVAG